MTMEGQQPDMNEATDSLKDLSITGMLNNVISEAWNDAVGPPCSEEQPIADPTIDQINISEASSPLPHPQILIVNQPELIDYKFR